MSLPSGTRVGPYELLAPIGSGGMGEVYRARDTRLDRDVAIKVLNPDVAMRPEAHMRFEREARAASALSHPNVAHIYEIGEIGDSSGGRFIAMEYVDGARLDQKMAGQPMPADQIVEVGAAIADALDAAHAKGVIHRDIKPANVMFTSRGQVKVLDFGLARIEAGQQPLDDKTRSASQIGVILGTVQYMSPEQALGRPVDARTDLFSLGVVLYEMSTGRLPFTGLTTTETIERIAHAQPDAVSRFNYSISPELERIIRKCLEKDPDRRYQSARELLVDLRNLKRDSDGHTRPEPAIAGTPAFSKRSLMAAGVALLLVAAAGWFGWSRYARGAGIDSIVVLPFSGGTGDPETEYLADGLTDTVIENLSKLPNLRIVPRGIAFRFRGKDIDPRAVAKELNVAAVVMGRVTQRGNDVMVQAELIDAATLSRVWGGRYDRPMSSLVALQAELTEAIARKIDPSLGRPEQARIAARQTTNSEAYQLYLKGRYHWNKRTEPGFRLALEQFKQAVELDPSYAAAYAGQADCYSLLGRYQFEPPDESFPLARAAARKALELDDSTAEVHASLGYVLYQYDHDWAGSERAFKRAIELDPTYATAHHWYGLMLSATGNMDASIRELSEASRLDPLSGIIASNLGRAYYYAGRFDQALAQIEKAMQLDPNFGEGLLRLGLVYDQLGRYDDAIAAYRKAIDRSNTTSAVGPLGHAYARAGRTREALAVLKDLEKAAGGRRADPYDRALVYIALGRKDDAFRALDGAAEGSGMISYAKVDPKLQPLRDDPRFAALLTKMKLR